HFAAFLTRTSFSFLSSLILSFSFTYLLYKTWPTKKTKNTLSNKTPITSPQQWNLTGL
ncbi:hypothetical protein F4703DRAFT_1946100, partial [Phycomyces blakesleeanus]